MRFEHFAINVPDASAMARWYVANLDMRIVRGSDSFPFAHFLADSTGRTIIEIYSNPADPIPDYSWQHHFRFHFAFAADDLDTTMQKLILAGASLAIDETIPDGSRIITLRDLWGIPFQLARRIAPLP